MMEANQPSFRGERGGKSKRKRPECEVQKYGGPCFEPYIGVNGSLLSVNDESCLLDDGVVAFLLALILGQKSPLCQTDIQPLYVSVVSVHDLDPAVLSDNIALLPFLSTCSSIPIRHSVKHPQANQWRYMDAHAANSLLLWPNMRVQYDELLRKHSIMEIFMNYSQTFQATNGGQYVLNPDTSIPTSIAGADFLSRISSDARSASSEPACNVPMEVQYGWFDCSTGDSGVYRCKKVRKNSSNDTYELVLARHKWQLTLFLRELVGDDTVSFTTHPSLSTSSVVKLSGMELKGLFAWKSAVPNRTTREPVVTASGSCCMETSSSVEHVVVAAVSAEGVGVGGGKCVGVDSTGATATSSPSSSESTRRDDLISNCLKSVKQLYLELCHGDNTTCRATNGDFADDGSNQLEGLLLNSFMLNLMGYRNVDDISKTTDGSNSGSVQFISTGHPSTSVTTTTAGTDQVVDSPMTVDKPVSLKYPAADENEEDGECDEDSEQGFEEDSTCGEDLVCKVLSIDCEMCTTCSGELELTRITAVCPLKGLVMNMLVKPFHEVVDYHTEYSGITPELLSPVTANIFDMQRELRKYVNKDTILVGHSLHCDLHACRLYHGRVIDIAALYPHPKGLPFKISLKKLAEDVLGKEIQNSTGGHDSLEDAAITLELCLLKAKHGHEYGSDELRMNNDRFTQHDKQYCLFDALQQGCELEGSARTMSCYISSMTAIGLGANAPWPTNRGINMVSWEEHAGGERMFGNVQCIATQFQESSRNSKCLTFHLGDEIDCSDESKSDTTVDVLTADTLLHTVDVDVDMGGATSSLCTSMRHIMHSISAESKAPAEPSVVGTVQAPVEAPGIVRVCNSADCTDLSHVNLFWADVYYDPVGGGSSGDADIECCDELTQLDKALGQMYALLPGGVSTVKCSQHDHCTVTDVVQDVGAGAVKAVGKPMHVEDMEEGEEVEDGEISDSEGDNYDRNEQCAEQEIKSVMFVITQGSLRMLRQCVSRKQRLRWEANQQRETAWKSSHLFTSTAGTLPERWTDEDEADLIQASMQVIAGSMLWACK